MGSGSLSRIEYEVLAATASDVEDLEQIYGKVRAVDGPHDRAEVAGTVLGLVEKGLLAAMGEEDRPGTAPLEPDEAWRVRFSLTPRGREAWEGPGHESPSTPASGRLGFGACEDIAVDIPLEEFREARRAIARGFPRGGSG